MSLSLWQTHFESWFQLNWVRDDKVHDIAYLRRV